MFAAWLPFLAGVLVSAGELPRPAEFPLGLSGLTRVSNDVYRAINDKGARLCTFSLPMDRATGALTNCVPGTVLRLDTPQKHPDMEGVAWDAAAGIVWVTDETDASVRGFDPVTGAFRAEVAVPPVQRACVSNRSLESLALSPAGDELWTCNEEALPADGPLSTRTAGSPVRLTRFTRTSPADPWRAAGEWVYETDPMDGLPFADRSCSGVADLVRLSTGELLALEREFTIRRGHFLPTFRARIYRVETAAATDVSAFPALAGKTYVKARKTLLWEADTRFVMYEGICEGPRLADGARTLVLVSDADEGAAPAFLSLVYR